PLDPPHRALGVAEHAACPRSASSREMDGALQRLGVRYLLPRARLVPDADRARERALGGPHALAGLRGGRPRRVRARVCPDAPALEGRRPGASAPEAVAPRRVSLSDRAFVPVAPSDRSPRA